MATSSKVLFKLETLRAKALESLDFRIAQAQLEVESYDDDAALDARIKEWERVQKERILELAAQIKAGTVDTYTLSRFSIAKIPEIDRWSRNDAAQRLARLVSSRTKIVAKSEALVPDENGNVSLTKTQLDEFFAL